MMNYIWTSKYDSLEWRGEAGRMSKMCKITPITVYSWFSDCEVRTGLNSTMAIL